MTQIGLAFAAGIMITISVVEIAPSALRSLGEMVGTTEALLWVPRMLG